MRGGEDRGKGMGREGHAFLSLELRSEIRPQLTEDLKKILGHRLLNT